MCYGVGWHKHTSGRSDIAKRWLASQHPVARHQRPVLVTKVQALQRGPVPAKATRPSPIGSRPSPAPHVPKPPPTPLHKTTIWAKEASAIVRERTATEPPWKDNTEAEAVMSSEDETDQTWGAWRPETVDRQSSSSHPVSPWRNASKDDWVGSSGDWAAWDSSWYADDDDQWHKSTAKWSSEAWNQPPEQHSSARWRSRSPPLAAGHVGSHEPPEKIFQYLCDDYNVDCPAFRAPWLDANCNLSGVMGEGNIDRH
jgi:hypothetical protein